jgi:ATP-binding cassette, subfamily C (CFTR/MRP), member 1
LTPVLTFATFAGTQAGGDNTLTVAKAFTTVALLSLINKPLSQITISLPVLAMAVTSFQRIQDFLNGKERDDNRQLELGKGGGSRSEKGVVSGHHYRPGKNLELVRLQHSSADLPTSRHDFIASLHGKFSWKEDTEPVIDISDWKIRRRALNFVLGPVGCGKSTLLKALLGELSTFDGTIHTNYSGVGYCSQSPWLPNDTVRNVIVGGADLDESWYETVVKACALEQDVQNWPNGDNTAAGTMGISMSGGQKHRIVCLSTHLALSVSADQGNRQSRELFIRERSSSSLTVSLAA